MMIIYGTKQSKRIKGYVAEYCSHCEDICQMTVYRIGVTEHLFWIPLGQGKYISAYGECNKCKTHFDLELADYENLVQTSNLPIEELIKQTNPKYGSDVTEQEFSAYQRTDAIRRSFLAHAQELNVQPFQDRKYDKTSLIALALTIFLPIGLALLSLSLPVTKEMKDTLYVFSLMLFFAALIPLSFIIGSQPTRNFKNNILPRIISDLSTLNVSEDELEENFNRFRKHGYRIRKFTSPKKVLKALSDRKYS